MTPMATYHLRIVTPDGQYFDGEAEKLIVRTTEGDLCLMARHMNYTTALGMGMATLVADGKTRHAACIGGMLSMNNNEATLVASSFEWAETIDLDRAKASVHEAEAILTNRDKLTAQEIALAEAKLKRAMVRQSVSKQA